ncbi:MAG TPA: DVUA0089 family protein [Tepidisphaeraceae bacterium]|jgi:uncharacterized delta-60 repeat protein|nr:DVUA0089 family protein [Tepidisphaeraceae bacterium]
MSLSMDTRGSDVRRKMQRAATAALREAVGQRRPALQIERLEDRRLLSASSVDTSFGGGDGVASDTSLTAFNDIALQGDGKIVAIGDGSLLLRYNANGSLDGAFGGGDGRVAVPFVAEHVELISGGKILVAGGTGSGDASTLALARFNSNGTIDTSFGGGDGIVTYAGPTSDRTGAVNDFAVLSSGKILATGETASGLGYVARFNADGSPDNAFGTDGSSSPTTTLPRVGVEGGTRSYISFSPELAVASNGRIYVGGTVFIGGRSDYDVNLFALNANGAIDGTFGPDDQGYVQTNIGIDYPNDLAEPENGRDQLKDLLVLPDGRVVAVSEYTFRDIDGEYADTNYRLLTYSAAGELSPNITKGPMGWWRSDNPYVNPTSAMVVGNNLYVVGSLGAQNWESSEITTFFVASYDITSSGIVGDNSFNPNPGEREDSFAQIAYDGYLNIAESEHSAVLVQPDGRILAAGRVGNFSGTPIPPEAQPGGALMVRYQGEPTTPAIVDTNDTLSTATGAPLNTTKTNQNIAADGTDVDLYRVTVQQGQRVGFDVDTNGSPLDSYMRLFDSTGRQIAANDDGIAPGEQIHRSPYLAYTFPAAGTYYVAVSGKDNRAYNPITGTGDTNGNSTGAYTLDVRVLPGPTPTDTNDRLSTATGAPLNTMKINQDIADGTDVDVFRITVAAGQRVGFDVDNNGSGLDSYLRLFDSSGRQLAANENGVAPGERIHLSPYVAYTFATAGTYYVAVSSTGNTGYDPLSGLGDLVGRSTGAYTLDIRVL